MVDSLAEMRQQSKRIATLKLRLWQIQKRFLSEPLPYLRRLEIFTDSNWEEGKCDTWAPVWGSMGEATSWSFPSSTSLIIYNLRPIPFYTPYLTCFKLLAELGPINADGLFDFLGGCPLLEHINIFYLRELPRYNPDLVISLPNLRTYTQTAPDSVRCSMPSPSPPSVRLHSGSGMRPER